MNRFSLNQSADHLITGVLRDQLRILSDAPIIKVKTRRKGITSGEKGRCYWNANLCAQSYGGEPVYGWAILPPEDYAPGITKLIGHGCWLSPEGIVINTTDCNLEEILFLPLSHRLILNGSFNEEVPDLYFLENGWEKGKLLRSIGLHSKYHVPLPVGSLDLFWGSCNENDLPLNHLFYPRFFLKDHVKQYKNLLLTANSLPDPRMVKELFSPYIETDLNRMRVHSHQPGLSIHHLVRSSVKNATRVLSHIANAGAHIGSLDCSYTIHRKVKDLLNGDKFYLVNPSVHTGKLIHQIPPCKTLLDRMIPRGNKKKLRKYEKIASENNLSVQELLLMNDPFYTPHPYLIHKSKRFVKV